VPVLEFLRQYTLREYTAVLAIALMGAAGVVFMLNAASGGPAGSGETLLKRETAHTTPVPMSSADAEHVAAVQRAKERARLLAERRRIRAMRAQRAARRAAVLAQARAKSAARRTVARSTPRRTSTAPARVVNPTPSPAPQQKPVAAPAPKPTPKKSGPAGGGGGGSFDDSG
jgi:hypothetical protein